MQINIYLITFFILVVCLYMKIHEVESSSPEFKFYTNKYNNFNLLYPSSWNIIEFSNDISDGDLKFLTTFISPMDGSNDKFQEFFTIKMKKINANEKIYPQNSFQEYFNNYTNKIEKSKFLTISEPEINKSSQIKTIDYNITSNQGLIFHKKEYILQKNEQVFHIEFTLTNDTPNTFAKTMKKIVTSFN